MQKLLTAEGKVRRVFFFSVFLCATVMPSFFPSMSWADAKSVAAAINAYEDGELEAVPSGSIVTVTGTETNATTALNLDITGVTVIWNATLTGHYKAVAPQSALVLVSGKGNFNVSGVIFNDTLFDTAAVEVRNGAALAVKGMVKAEGKGASAIYSKHGRIKVEKGGKVQSPQGLAIGIYAGEGDSSELSAVTLEDTTGLVGEVALVEDGRYVSTFYGTTTIDYDMNAIDRGKDKKRSLLVIAEKAEVLVTHNAHFTVGANVDMEIKKGSILLSGGTVTLEGTLKNEGAISNSGTFVNKGTLTNKGTMVNTGSITNDGKLVNEGIFDTMMGKVVNNGLIDNTRGKIDGEKNITGRGDMVDSRNGGGCNMGLGFMGFIASLGAGARGYLRRGA
ncbi:MAG: hypothetical protein LBS00_11900, partial [Synergistaceae bacterium]|nr:hypothetical protein [Synergistaceae bacterium]